MPESPNPIDSMSPTPDNVIELWTCDTTLSEVDKNGKQKEILHPVPRARVYFVRRKEAGKYVPRLKIYAENNGLIDEAVIRKNFNYSDCDNGVSFAESFTTHFSRALPLKELTVQAVEDVCLHVFPVVDLARFAEKPVFTHSRGSKSLSKWKG